MDDETCFDVALQGMNKRLDGIQEGLQSSLSRNERDFAEIKAMLQSLIDCTSPSDHQEPGDGSSLSPTGQESQPVPIDEKSRFDDVINRGGEPEQTETKGDLIVAREHRNPVAHKVLDEMPTRRATKKIDERIQLKGLIAGDYHIDLITSLAHDLSNIPILISDEDQLLGFDPGGACSSVYIDGLLGESSKTRGVNLALAKELISSNAHQVFDKLSAPTKSEEIEVNKEMNENLQLPSFFAGNSVIDNVQVATNYGEELFCFDPGGECLIVANGGSKLFKLTKHGAAVLCDSFELHLVFDPGIIVKGVEAIVMSLGKLIDTLKKKALIVWKVTVGEVRMKNEYIIQIVQVIVNNYVELVFDPGGGEELLWNGTTSHELGLVFAGGMELRCPHMQLSVKTDCIELLSFDPGGNLHASKALRLPIVDADFIAPSLVPQLKGGGNYLMIANYGWLDIIPKAVENLEPELVDNSFRTVGLMKGGVTQATHCSKVFKLTKEMLNTDDDWSQDEKPNLIQRIDGLQCFLKLGTSVKVHIENGIKMKKLLLYSLNTLKEMGPRMKLVLHCIVISLFRQFKGIEMPACDPGGQRADDQIVVKGIISLITRQLPDEMPTSSLQSLLAAASEASKVVVLACCPIMINSLPAMASKKIMTICQSEGKWTTFGGLAMFPLPPAALVYSDHLFEVVITMDPNTWLRSVLLQGLADRFLNLVENFAFDPGGKQVIHVVIDDNCCIRPKATEARIQFTSRLLFVMLIYTTTDFWPPWALGAVWTWAIDVTSFVFDPGGQGTQHADERIVVWGLSS